MSQASKAELMTQIPPFEASKELSSDGRATEYLENQIRDQAGTPFTKDEVEAYFRTELETPLLDEMYDSLWLVAKKSGSHVDSLHQHAIKKRTIKLAEDPKLHLIWYHGIIYIKPIPLSLLNHQFWRDFLAPPTSQGGQNASPASSLCRQALGFLRSYSYLVLHESDFVMAQEARLIPKDVDYSSFRRFIAPFRALLDSEVSPRYEYGQLRLTRLNWAVRLLRPRATKHRFPWYYQQRFWQTSQFLEQFGAPFLFIFAALSLVLSSMQVVFAARGNNTWAAFSNASWGFSVAVIIANIVLIVLLISGVAGLLIGQAQFAIRKKWAEASSTRAKQGDAATSS
jgi:hypothetical protein